MPRSTNASSAPVGRLVAVVAALLAAGAGLVRWGLGGSLGSGDGARGVARQSVHVELGIPRDGDDRDDVVVERPQYVLSYHPDRLVPNWASWRVVASDYGSTPRKKGNFLPDPHLPAWVTRVEHNDYTGSGYDRGHLVRSAERTSSRDDNDATFFLTNIVPQTHALNEGPWLRLEERCAELAQRERRELYVVAGPLFASGKKKPKTIGRGVHVPDELFKVVVAVEPGTGRAGVTEATPVIAVIMPNIDKPNGRWETYSSTVDAIEAKTGYDLLDSVDRAVQAVIEAR